MSRDKNTNPESEHSVEKKKEQKEVSKTEELTSPEKEASSLPEQDIKSSSGKSLSVIAFLCSLIAIVGMIIFAIRTENRFTEVDRFITGTPQREVSSTIIPVIRTSKDDDVERYNDDTHIYKDSPVSEDSIANFQTSSALDTQFSQDIVLLAEVTSLLSLAERALSYEGDVASARVHLERAHQLYSEGSITAKRTEVIEQMEQDIVALEDIAFDSVEAIYKKLDFISESTPSLPLKTSRLALKQRALTEEEGIETQDSDDTTVMSPWSRFLRLIKSVSKSIVVVEKVSDYGDDSDFILDKKSLVRQLQSSLADAKLALLSRRAAIFEAALMRALQILINRFDTTDANTSMIQDELTALLEHGIVLDTDVKIHSLEMLKDL